MRGSDHCGRCVTGKVKYASERESRAALVGAVVARNMGRRNRQEVRMYVCQVCGYWHLTSESRDEYEARRAGLRFLWKTAADDSTGSEGAPQVQGAIG